MKREAIQVEPISSFLNRWKTVPASPVTRAGNMVFVSGLPPFDPETGDLQWKLYTVTMKPGDPGIDS